MTRSLQIMSQHARSRRRSHVFCPTGEEYESRVLLSITAADVLTSHNNNARTGEDLSETTLTPSNVNSSSFGQLFTDPVDGYVYAQPLYMANVPIPGQGTHNVVFVATENDSVYAYDADTPGELLWHDSFTDPTRGITAVPTTALWEGDIGPLSGITGTPVIDASTGTLYVVAKTQQTVGRHTYYALTLHAINISTGAETNGNPVVVEATVAGTGVGHSGGAVSFLAQFEIERPALLLENNVVYASFGSLGDHGPYHGWVIGYNATTLAKVAVFNDSRNSIDPYNNEGGIWMDGAGPAADAAGNIYLLTGSGQFNPPRGSFSDTALKLSASLKVEDYFTPQGTALLDKQDLDLGSGGGILIPSDIPGKPDLLVGGGKTGVLYAINTGDMGHQKRVNPNAQAIDDPGHLIFSTPAYFNGSIYINEVGDVLRQYTLENGQFVGPVALSTQTFAYPGATPSISANGSADGIVWEIDHTGSRPAPGPAVLYAYNAADIGQVLYSSAMDPSRDQAGLAVKFAVSTIASGKVYVGTQTGISVYGLLS